MIRPLILKNIDIWNNSPYKAKYFRSMIQDTNYVLCSVSAAEYLGLYSGTTDTEIYVFTKIDCIANRIETGSKNGLFYTSINQTINDLLSSNTVDEQVIIEALASQYFKNEYADLTILPENQEAFKHFRLWAEEYYSY